MGLGFHTTKTVTETVNSKEMKIKEIRYWGFWTDLRFMEVDYEQTLVEGVQIRQYLNGRLFQTSV